MQWGPEVSWAEEPGRRGLLEVKHEGTGCVDEAGFEGPWVGEARLRRE